MRGTFTHVGTLLLTFSNLCDHYGVLTDGNNSSQRMTTVTTDCHLVKEGKKCPKRNKQLQKTNTTCLNTSRRRGNYLASNVFLFHSHNVLANIFVSSAKRLHLNAQITSRPGLEAAVNVFSPKHPNPLARLVD